jgi:hypothetical protein
MTKNVDAGMKSQMQEVRSVNMYTAGRGVDARDQEAAVYVSMAEG